MNRFKRTWAVCRLCHWHGFWWLFAMFVVLAAGGLFSWWLWGDLMDDDETLSTTIRNIGLVIGGIEAALLAAWRSTVAGRQADTAHQSLLGERYERGVAMLSNDSLTIRLGGIEALRRLAEEFPEQYHLQINRLLCDSVPRKADRHNGARQMHEREVTALIHAIGARTRTHIRVERDQSGNYRPNFREADLERIIIVGANLSNADLTDAIWTNGRLSRVDLSAALLRGANMSNTNLVDGTLERAVLDGADLSGTSLSRLSMRGSVLIGANVTGTQFECVTGLTKLGLMLTPSDPDNPPVFRSVIDADTGEPIKSL